MKINDNFSRLEQSYFFMTIVTKTNEYAKNNPDKQIIKLGIGDVTLPLGPVVIDAMQKAVSEMSKASTLRGYGPEQGYEFTQKAVQGYYKRKGVDLETGEIFISDGAGTDIGNTSELFDMDNTVLIPNPVYPAYVDTNLMAGRKVVLIEGNIENNFLPMPDENTIADIIYLCSPNNPTGAVYSKAQLQEWVDFANKNDAVIIFDAAYEAFPLDKSFPTSIYQISGAKKCAIEICSFSKYAGFTGIRCGFTVVPHELKRGPASLNKMWFRRQTTKFNGVSYITQRGAQAALSEEGIKQAHANLDYYRENAKIIVDTLRKLGIWFTGGENSPYVWFKCPNGMTSWEFFDYLLCECQIVGTPGAGFGQCGEGFFRLSSFGKREDVITAMQRLTTAHKFHIN